MKRGIDYLELIPIKNSELPWKKLDNGMYEITISHKGLYDKLVQIMFHTPIKSKIRLDKFGSYVWEYINGVNTVRDIADNLYLKFGDLAEPLYYRLVKFMQILKREKFIVLEKSIK